ncbi:DUF3237 family protein [Pseudolysinimonas sp.]|jgi:hypothetical protein|uniref:DUF3237 family protein n=1 Tax=Pseudolysinimonas sp. TaxID=2680009 RepID=UPI0037848A42
MNPVLELRLIARLRVGIGEFLEAGEVPDGRRRVIPIGAGTVDGPELFGEVLPLGADWNLVRADGSETVSARYVIRTRDGVLLSVANDGVITDRPAGRLGITSLKIEAPRDGDYAWLNDAVLVGSLGVDDGPSGVVIILEYWCAVAG